MFCSDKCSDEAFSKYRFQLDYSYLLDTGTPARVMKVVDDLINSTESLSEALLMIEEAKILAKTKDSTIFSYNWRNPNNEEAKKNLMMCILNLSSDINVVDVTEVLEEAMKILRNDEKRCKVLEKLLVQLAITDQINLLEFKQYDRFTFEQTVEASGIFPFGSLINHSCDSNVHPTVVDNKIVWICTRPIPEDGQILRNYGTSLDQSLSKVKKFLRQKYGFACTCCFCRLGVDRLVKRDKSFKEPEMKSFTNISDAKKELEKNWRYINKHEKNHPNYELDMLMTRNVILLDCISNAMFSQF